MKLLKIVMSAFGSYADCVEVDFTRINSGLFLVTGDTGSGKTTLFDAIVYALYDQTSGGQRDGRMMRSQYASEDDRTFVSLTFLYRDKVYTVTRSPEYERASKRKQSDGTVTLTKEKAKVALVMPDGTVCKGRKKDIDREIVEIIGLDANQFMQVAMIAQGDFMRLLHASSKERKVIFSKIFRTGLYWRIQENLKNEARVFFGQLEDTRKLYVNELSRTIAVPNSQEAAQLEELTGKSYPDAASVEALLTEICEQDSKRYEKAEAQRQQMEQKITDLQTKVVSIHHQNEVMKQYEDTLNDVRMKRAAFQHKKNQLEVQKKENEEALKISQESYDRNAQKLQETIYHIRRILPVYDDAAAKKVRLHETEAEIARLTDRQTMLLENLEELTAHQKMYDEQLGKKAELTETYMRLSHQAQDAMTYLQRMQQLVDQMRQAAGQEIRCREALALHQAADQNYREKEQAYEQLYHLFLEEQAGILAENLEEGIPCPVCGAVHHPQPALFASKAPDQKTVNQAQALSKKAMEQRQQCMAEFQKQNGIYQEMVKTVQREGRLLLDDAWQEDLFFIEEKKKEFEVKAKQFSREAKMAGKKLDELEKIQKLQADTGEKLIAVQKEAASLGDQMQSKTQLQMALQGEIQTLGLQLVYETKEAATAVLKKNEQELHALEQALQNAQKACRDTESDIAHISGRLQASVEEEKQALLAEEEGRRLFLERLQKEGFTDEVAYLQVMAKEEDDLKEKIAHLTEERQQNEMICRQLYMAMTRNRQVAQQIQKIREQYESLNSQYQIWQNLSRTANGSLSGNVKIDLETYVLRYYFKQIIEAANRRLVQMNRGQFVLQCTAMENLGSQGEAGLNLDVCSLVTGRVRDIRTLSGGESFMAALAMALGMADMVGRMAGAVRIETMFVDEGFGSLDENAREQAIRILKQLAGGDRTIGIISHVSELRDEIEDQLQVEKKKHGSTICWV